MRGCCGLGDIEEAKRIEEEKKWEEAEAQEKREEAEAEAFAREALGLGGGGAEGGGAAGGGAGDVFQQVNEAKETLNENIQKLGEMADKTEEMRVNAAVSARSALILCCLSAVAAAAAGRV